MNQAEYYDNVHYSGDLKSDMFKPLLLFARKIGVKPGDSILDYGCGKGDFLRAARFVGADVSGIDISEKAISFCRENIDGDFIQSSVSIIPFDDNSFDVVTCLGVLEHLEDKDGVLSEMVRVSKGKIVICVPIKEFLFYKIGLFKGTDQVKIREDIYSTSEWIALFKKAGLKVEKMFSDDHLFTKFWIFNKGILRFPYRFLLALFIKMLPLKYQYQVNFICEKDKNL